LGNLTKLEISKIFVEAADRCIEATLLKLVLELIASIRVVDQQDIGQRNAFEIPHLSLGSVFSRNVVGEESLGRFWGMEFRWFRYTSRGDTLTFVFDDP
jgi:hypothetical protein